MRIAFFGTTEFSLQILRLLLNKKYNIVCIYTQPPRKAGRGKKLSFCPVLKFAVDNNLNYKTPSDFNSNQTLNDYLKFNFDVGIVVAYGMILPGSVLFSPKFGCFNIHTSLLPRWRGAAPIQRAILANDNITGVTIIKMVEGLDAGPIVFKKKCSIANNEDFGSLEKKLLQISKSLVEQLLEKISDLKFVDQPSEGICYAKKILKNETKIKWNDTARNINLLIRAFSPLPGAWFEINNERIKILSCKVCSEEGKPGEILNENFMISCSEESLQPQIIQRAGKEKMDLTLFLRGFKFQIGEIID